MTRVTRPQEKIPGRYERSRRSPAANVNAVFENAALGVTEFLVNGAHDGTRNILEDLDEREELVAGSRRGPSR